MLLVVVKRALAPRRLLRAAGRLDGLVDAVHEAEDSNYDSELDLYSGEYYLPQNQRAAI